MFSFVINIKIEIHFKNRIEKLGEKDQKTEICCVPYLLNIYAVTSACGILSINETSYSFLSPNF